MKKNLGKMLAFLASMCIITSTGIAVSAQETYKNQFVNSYGYTYYYNEFDIMSKNSLVGVDDKIYYMDYNGQRQTGWVDIPYDVKSTGSINFMDKEKYVGNRYFRADGTMVYDSLVKFGDLIYGFNGYGKQVKNDFAIIKGSKCKFDKEGNKVSISLDNVDEVEKYLNAFYGEIELPNKFVDIKWIISEGDKDKKPYDYSIVAHISPDDFSADSYKTRSVMSDTIIDLQDTERYTNKEREQGNKVLQDTLILAAQSVMKIDPNAKIEAYYYESWHDKPETWRVYTNKLHTYKWMLCQNYQTSEDHNGEYGYTEYKRSKKTKLRWIYDKNPI